MTDYILLLTLDFRMAGEFSDRTNLGKGTVKVR
jgi:hypothetical protein